MVARGRGYCGSRVGQLSDAADGRPTNQLCAPAGGATCPLIDCLSLATAAGSGGAKFAGSGLPQADEEKKEETVTVRSSRSSRSK